MALLNSHSITSTCLKKMVLQGFYNNANGSIENHEHSKNPLHDKRVLCMVKCFFRLMESVLFMGNITEAVDYIVDYKSQFYFFA